jgi:hypothetical protein
MAAGAAQAQRGPGAATLYEFPNFQGRAVTITGTTPDLGSWRFNDRAQSARFQGTWRVCEHDGFKGRCQEIRGEVADLTTYGLSGQISSMEPAGFGGGRPPGGGPGPGPGGGWGPPGQRDRGFDGVRTVFYPRPVVRAWTSSPASSRPTTTAAARGSARRCGSTPASACSRRSARTARSSAAPA